MKLPSPVLISALLITMYDILDYHNPCLYSPIARPVLMRLPLDVNLEIAGHRSGYIIEYEVRCLGVLCQSFLSRSAIVCTTKLGNMESPHIDTITRPCLLV